MAGGTHDDSDGATGANRNMPADRPAKQRDWGSSGKGGTHSDSGKDWGPTPKPSELKSSIGSDGTGTFVGNADKVIEFGSQDPRRSHS